MSQARDHGPVISDETILEVVLEAMRTTNAARPPSSLLTVSPDAALFGPGSPLDSLGLLTLLLDIEDGHAACRVPGAVERRPGDVANAQSRSAR